MEPFKEVELIKELKSLGTGSRAEISKTTLEQNRVELGNYFTNLQEVSPSDFAFKGQFTKKQDLTFFFKWEFKINILTNIRFNSDSQITQSCM